MVFFGEVLVIVVFAFYFGFLLGLVLRCLFFSMVLFFCFLVCLFFWIFCVFIGVGWFV